MRPDGTLGMEANCGMQCAEQDYVGTVPESFRTIHLGIQGNSFAYTGKVLREYRQSA
jgi:hypothetical protein